MQPIAHFFTHEEKSIYKSSLCVSVISTIRLSTSLNAEMTSCISSVSMFKSLVVSIGKGNDVRAPLKESRREETMTSNTLQSTTKL